MLVQSSLYDLVSQVTGHISLVLKDAAVKIHKIHGAVGSCVGVYDSGSFVGRRQEFTSLIRSCNFECSVLFVDDGAFNEQA